jgi:hypothetical protein
LLSLQPRNVIVNVLFSGQIEEIFFENLCRTTHVFIDGCRQRALCIDRPFKGDNDWDSEIAEQPSKVLYVRFMDFAPPVSCRTNRGGSAQRLPISAM